MRLKMKKMILAFFIFGLAGACKVIRKEPESLELSSSTVPNPCSLSKDPFEPDSTFPLNMQKGGKIRCLATRTARPVVVLSSSEAAEYGYQNLENTVVLANVTHRNKFFVAAIPIAIGDVSSVILQQENFESNLIPAAHAQIRLDFKKPVLLTPQDKSAGSQPIQTNHLILSMEALGEVGAQFDVIKGLRKEYVGVWRIKTLTDFALRMDSIRKKDKGDSSNPGKLPTVKQYLLKFEKDPEKRVAILKNWIRKSTERQLSVAYNTIGSSCAMEALNLIESARPTSEVQKDDQKNNFLAGFPDQVLRSIDRAKEAFLRYDGSVSTPFEVYPVFSKLALQIRGLLEKELPELGDDPAFKTVLEIK